MTPDIVPDTFPSLFWSYTATWFLLVAYIVSLGHRVSRIEKSISQPLAKEDEGKQ